MALLHCCLTLALVLAASSGAHAAPTFTNHSTCTWFLEFSDRDRDLEQLKRDNPLHANTVFTATWAGGKKHGLFSRLGEFKGVKLKPKDSIILSAESELDLAEIFTLRDADGRVGLCSIQLRTFGTKTKPRGVEPSVTIRLWEHLDQAATFQQEGVVLEGRADVHLWASSYASIFGAESKGPDLSPVPEGVHENGTPSRSGGEADATAETLALPAPARSGEWKAPADKFKLK